MATVSIPWKTPPPPPRPTPPKLPPIHPQVIYVPRLEHPSPPSLPPQPFKVYGSHPCPSCGAAVSDERLEVVGVPTCPKCTPPSPRPLGVMEYPHKTAGSLVIVHSQAALKALKRPANRRR